MNEPHWENQSELQIEAVDALNLMPFELDSLRLLPSIPPTAVFISASPLKRQQVYGIELDQTMNFVRRQGLKTTLGAGEYFFLDACDEEGQTIVLAVKPDFFWQQSSYWLNVDLIEWSVQNEEEIFNIIFHGLTNVCNFFGWTLRGLLAGKSTEIQHVQDCIYLMDQSRNPKLVVQADAATLDYCELKVRQYSLSYHQNCLWLGGKISFKLEVYLNSIQSLFKFSEIIALNVGDLIPLKQNWHEPSVARLAALVTCRSAQGNLWRRKIFLRIDNEDARMEFGDESWELDEENSSQAGRLGTSNADGFKMGENGPDAVELDILIGTTTISFNELCNIQEGSLIEVSRSTLPIVRMNVAGETVLEGELVRLGDQLMVQVTKKVS